VIILQAAGTLATSKASDKAALFDHVISPIQVVVSMFALPVSGL
jgi:hypothetical protein